MSRTLALAAALALPAPALAHDWNGLAFDPEGRLYAVDAEDGQVWRVAPDGRVEVFLPGSSAEETCYHFHHLAFDGQGVLWLPSG